MRITPFHFLVLGTIVVIHMTSSTIILETSKEEPPDKEHLNEIPSEFEDKIESGIVFINRGQVLLTGENWIVAKEFNITDIASLVNEAKSLFPSIRRRLENKTLVEDENIWDLQFFRDSIIQEINVIEPIINKIENKIRIFENLLPRNSHGNFQSHVREKRFIGNTIKLLLTLGLPIVQGIAESFFEAGDDEEIQNLNDKYEQMLRFRDSQLRMAEIEKMLINHSNKSVDEIKTEMIRTGKLLYNLEKDQKEKIAAINSRVNTNIETVLRLDNEIDVNDEKIKKLKSNISATKRVFDRRLLELNKSVEIVKNDVMDITGTAVKHYSIISNLKTLTRQNRKSIYEIKRALGNSIVTWKSSLKQITDQLNMIVSITAAMRMMEMRLLNIDTGLTGLLEALDTISTGRLSPNLVSPIDLLKILKDIEEHLSPGVYPLTLIKEDAIYEYYTYATVYAVAIPSAIRVFIKLPLKTPDRTFHLFEPYPLPYFHENASVFLQIAKPSDYVLVSSDLQKVAEIEETVLEKCKEKNKMYLCSPEFTIYEGNKCSFSLIKEDENQIIKFCVRSVVVPSFKSKWIRVEGGWIYSVPRMTRLTHVHENGSTQTELIKDTGFINHFPHTYISLDDGTVLFSNNQQGAKLIMEDQIFLPKVPDLLLLNESSRIINESELEDIIEELSKANSENAETVDVYNLLNQVKSALVEETPETSSGVMVFVLAVAVLVNYIIMGFVFCSKTRRNLVE